MYHPAAALHQQSLRQVLKTDALKIPQVIASAKKLSSKEKTEAQQLSLF
jgi:lambda repressor-like predicted transcriptional regulator